MDYHMFKCEYPSFVSTSVHHKFFGEVHAARPFSFLCCFSSFCVCFPMLSVSQDCKLLIASSVYHLLYNTMFFSISVIDAKNIIPLDANGKTIIYILTLLEFEIDLAICMHFINATTTGLCLVIIIIRIVLLLCCPNG